MNIRHITKAGISNQFEDILHIIQNARIKALQSVNEHLVNLYWQVGEIISKKVASAAWGNKTVDELADYIRKNNPELKGFNRRGLYRMKQFYECYHQIENVSSMLTQISWSSHLTILSKTKTIEEKKFYINLAIHEKYSVRELDRQISSSLFERQLLSDKKVTTVLTQLHPHAADVFRDSYVFEFLDLPSVYSENDLRNILLGNLKNVILELGKDFIFVAKEFRLQVGTHDFYIDLLFYHRDLCCLVAFELKTVTFKPEFLGQLNFYLEALDRDIKKQHEKPSIGVLLCKGKDSEVVEYALSRSLSPAMIAEYSLKLPDKKLLLDKLHQLEDYQNDIKNTP